MAHRCALLLAIAILLLCGCETTKSSSDAGLPPEIHFVKDGIDSPVNTPAGQYDMAMFKKIQTKWFELAEEQPRDKVGTVKVAFKMFSDGSVQDVTILEKSADLKPEFLDYCRRAVLESAPFDPFPEKLHKQFGNERKINIHFQYTL